MFSTIHGTVGAIIGKTTGNVFLGFAGGILAHYIFDAIPHGDEKLIAISGQPTPREIKKIGLIAVLDAIMMLIILGLLAYLGKIPADWVIAFSVLGGLLPDIDNAFYLLLRQPKILKSHFDLHFKMHSLLQKYELTLVQGVILQLLIEAGLIGIIFSL